MDFWSYFSAKFLVFWFPSWKFQFPKTLQIRIFFCSTHWHHSSLLGYPFLGCNAGVIMGLTHDLFPFLKGIGILWCLLSNIQTNLIYFPQYSNCLWLEGKSSTHLLIKYWNRSPEDYYLFICSKREDGIAMVYVNENYPIKKGNPVLLERNDISEANPLRAWEWL